MLHLLIELRHSGVLGVSGDSKKHKDIDLKTYAKYILKEGSNDEIPNIDFSLNERAFIKKYASGFSGQEFFTLVSAFLAGGVEGVQVELASIKAVWKRCSGIIKLPYASIFSTRAKENSWVDIIQGKRGVYTLGKHWRDIFKEMKDE